MQCKFYVNSAKNKDFKISTAPVLLKENDIPEASLAGRKPAELGKANLLFWQLFKCDRESTARKTTVCFLMFTSNDTYRLATTTKLKVNLECFLFSLSFRQTAQIKLNPAFLVLFFVVVSLPVSRVGLQVAPRQIYVSPPIHNDVSRNQVRE